MAVRKRTWTWKGETREKWIVDYRQNGERHIETFDRKKDADAREAKVKVNVGKGVHTPTGQSITVVQAADAWLEYVQGEGRERSTVTQYRQHVTLHIAPRLGNEKIAKLTEPRINQFRDDLIRSMSRAMAKKVLTSLKMILKDAKRRGCVAQNVAADVSITSHGRTKTKLEIGRDIPSRDEIKRILDAAKPGRGRALLITAALTGVRASELRGLRWCDVDLKAREISIRQRADAYHAIGAPKSVTSNRTIPIGDMVTNVLREWRLQCPKGDADLVFPTGKGTVESHANITQRILEPAQIAAGVVDSDGKPKYGMHSLRHFYASWCINRQSDGGLGLPIKVVQSRMGHSSITMTSDTYGHLFPRGDDGAELTKAERSLFAL